jgi:hypothetical protein
MTNQCQIKLLCFTVVVSALMTLSFTGCQSPSKTGSSITTYSTTTNAWGDTEIMPGPNAGSSQCGSHCSFVVFNNNGAGFMPTCSQATITVKINGQAVPTAQYEVLWRYSALKKGCAQYLSETQKQYANVSGKKYNYTVYFKPGYCPPAGTTIEIFIECLATLQGTSATKSIQQIPTR